MGNTDSGLGAEALLQVIAAAVQEEDVTGYRLGGDEFVFGGDDEGSVRAAVDGIRERLREAEIEATLPDGSVRVFRGPRVHAGIGRSFDAAARALSAAKRAGVAAGERAQRGARPRGLAEVSGGPAALATEVGMIYLRALGEADPLFGEGKTGDSGLMSPQWVIRNMRAASHRRDR